MKRDEGLLLALLNSAPVVDGRPTDDLDDGSGEEFARRWGGVGTAREIERLRRARDALQYVVRSGAHTHAAELTVLIAGAVRTPVVTSEGIEWELNAPEADRLTVEAILAWSNINARFPGRLRACANDECNLFLLDHSRPGTAKWCSMATCGNRMKVRAHASRSRV